MTRLFRMNTNDFKELKEKYRTNSETIKVTDANIEFLIIADEEKLEMPTKQLMTRIEAINSISSIFSNILEAERIVDFYIKAGMLEVKEESSIDWSKPLFIYGRKGKLDVIQLGIGFKGKLIVQIEDDLTVDGTQPKIYVPTINGYVVEFDAYIFNE